MVENFPNARARLGGDARFVIDEQWLSLRTEEPIDADRPIVDPHHHLWHRSAPYLVPELLSDLNCGHNLRATVYVEGGFMYRADGDPARASIGEIEYVNGIGAAFASGYYGPIRACAGIVGKVDLTMGAVSEELLADCIARAPDRFRGVRHMTAWDASPDVSSIKVPPPPDLMLDPKFREGFGKLAPLGLSFDSYCLHTQLEQLLGLIDEFPDTRVVVNHLGGRIGEGPYAARHDEVFKEWRSLIDMLAERPNVFMKIGGLNMRLAGFRFIDRDAPPASEELADAWKPYVETCLEAFGPARSMFESNFPPDKAGCSARTLWNAFKRIAAEYSEDEKSQLFAKTAIQCYRLPESLASPA